MKYFNLKSNNILRLSLFLSIFLVLIIFFLYRSYNWPAGSEALGCLAALVILSVSLIMLLVLKNKIIDELQEKNVAFGLCVGLLWTIEIGINNLIRPGLPLRDFIDNTFWGLISMMILIRAFTDAFKTDRFSSGLKSGFWSGFSSGAVACFTALFLIVFGMKYILLDPLNIKEWSDVKATTHFPGMEVYFAYQTFTGALMHLIILGAILGLLLGLLGTLLGKTVRIIKRQAGRYPVT